MHEFSVNKEASSRSIGFDYTLVSEEGREGVWEGGGGGGGGEGREQREREGKEGRGEVDRGR